MEKAKQLREEIRKRNDLLPKLIEMWKNNASVDETMKVIKDAGFDVTYEEVENLLVLIQKKHAEGISFEKMNVDELAKVTGGCGWCAFFQSAQGSGDSCKGNFKYWVYDTREHCLFDEYCDEQFNEIITACRSNIY